jgi:hypothetical protein
MRTLLLNHARRYPAWELTDLYKLLHQAAMGAEHALTNEAGVREWLTRELAELSLDAGAGEPLVDPISPDGQLVRVHLRPFAQLGLAPEPLLQAFFRTAREIQPAPEQLVASAQTAVQLAQEGLLPFDAEALTTFFAERAAQNFPAYHHSDAFRRHYQPAYRVVARALLPEELKERHEAPTTSL